MDRLHHNLLRFALFAILQIIATVEGEPLVNFTNTAVNNANIQTLTFIGTVQGKSYFVEPNPMTWLEAENLCKQSNLKLGSIRTQSHAKLLKDALAREFHYVNFWVSGEESRSPQSMVWSGTNVNPDVSLVDYYGYVPPDYQNHYCHFLYSDAIRNILVLHVAPCTYSTFGVLCET